ncbi:unnamed protein product [Larinioides sclopetarius]|uniref:Uncharacterized protein n=1 Tax=Larinioides sclopetarius TaxID=280406 RepID=A0AAV2ATL5_9ARAC
MRREKDDFFTGLYTQLDFLQLFQFGHLMEITLKIILVSGIMLFAKMHHRGTH